MRPTRIDAFVTNAVDRSWRLRGAAMAVIALSLSTSGAASDQPDRHKLALVAGYKASFLCSGLFNAGQSVTEIEADDLNRIYPDFRASIAALPATVDPQARTVAVSFASDMPPRYAVWRPVLGCTQLPTGAPLALAAALPRLSLTPPADLDGRPWPLGERDAGGKLPRRETERLQKTIEAAFDGRSFGEGTATTAVLIIDKGKIVGERYRSGYGPHVPQRTWSAAKSLTGTLIGIAVGKGLMTVDDPAPIPEWKRPGDPRAAITLRQLLQMASGLWSEEAGNRTDDIYFGGTSVTEKAVQMPLEAPPGKRYRYANDDTLLAARALRASLGDGEQALSFPYTELLWKLGMTRTTLETDWRGNFILSSQVWTTARDLARLGLLYLDGGVWQGSRVLPRDWPTFVSTPAPSQPDDVATGGPRYGAQFWIFGPEQGLPDGTYAAQGSRGQYLMIVPARGVVVVRRGFDAVGDGNRFDIAAFTRDVLSALAPASARKSARQLDHRMQ